MTTNVKSESIICHIWNTTVLLTEKSCAKLTKIKVDFEKVKVAKVFKMYWEKKNMELMK